MEEIIVEKGDMLQGIELPYSQIPNHIIDSEDLKVNEKMILVYLYRCGNQGNAIFPSYNTIAKKCGISRSTTIRAIKSLIDKGAVIKQQRRKSNSYENAANLYILNQNFPEDFTEQKEPVV